MGKRGPAPKPTALKLIDGNPGRRAINRKEPKPTAIIPKCPPWLSAAAKKEWRRVVPELERMGLMTIVDAAALTGYCVSWARLIEAQKFIEEHGMFYTVKDKVGQLKSMNKVPHISISEKAMDSMKAFCKEFGFTPSSRSGMIADPVPVVASKFAKFRGGGGH